MNYCLAARRLLSHSPIKQVNEKAKEFLNILLSGKSKHLSSAAHEPFFTGCAGLNKP
jgi:hypothetical protein